MPLTPPTAKRIPTTSVLHGHVRVDDYAYFRDKQHPETLPYLEAENAYTDAMMAHTQDLQARLYEEIVGRLKEDDTNVPVQMGEWYYNTRTEKGKQYPIFVRHRGAPDAPEEVYFDQNVEAEGYEFYQLGGLEVSPDHSRLAVLVDTNGYEDFTLRVKDLRTGQWLDDQVEKAGFGLAWASDNATLFYLTFDEAKRADTVWRHVIGTPRAEDVLVYHEPDVLFNTNVDRSRSGGWILITASSFTSSEVRVIPAAAPTTAPRVLAARRPGVEYDVEPGATHFYITTNDGAQNFKVQRAAFDAAGPTGW